jgi:hypothetical protein
MSWPRRDRISYTTDTLRAFGVLLKGVLTVKHVSAQVQGEQKMATTPNIAQEKHGGKHAFVQGVHGVRYQVKDVARSVTFYTTHLGFTLGHQQLPAFANVSLGDVQILLSGPQASGSRPMPNGQQQEPGGWNRVVLRVSDLPAFIGTLKPPFSKRHGNRSWGQANSDRGSRRQSDRVVRAGAIGIFELSSQPMLG